jgi:hypothetical protein
MQAAIFVIVCASGDSAMQIDTVANISPTTKSGRVAGQVAGMNNIEVRDFPHGKFVCSDNGAVLEPWRGTIIQYAARMGASTSA